MRAIEVLKHLLDKVESEVPDDARMVELNVPVDIVRGIISVQPERCNQCGFITFVIEGHFTQYNFCPNCGARMKEGKEREID